MYLVLRGPKQYLLCSQGAVVRFWGTGNPTTMICKGADKIEKNSSFLMV
jgi:hypothetical protein